MPSLALRAQGFTKKGRFSFRISERISPISSKDISPGFEVLLFYLDRGLWYGRRQIDFGWGGRGHGIPLEGRLARRETSPCAPGTPQRGRRRARGGRGRRGRGRRGRRRRRRRRRGP